MKTHLWKGMERRKCRLSCGRGWRGESEDLSVEGDGEEKVKTYLWKGMERRK